MIDLNKIPPGDQETINVLVEIPKGSQNKYEFDKELNVFKLDRVLFSPFHYPGDYGFVPQTLAEDGDPLDALVLVSFRTFTGCLVKARPIGLLRMIDAGKVDDKILCVSDTDPRMEPFKDIKNLNSHLLDEIGHFFKVYKELEGKKVKVIGWKGAKEAKLKIKQAIARYSKTHK